MGGADIVGDICFYECDGTSMLGIDTFEMWHNFMGGADIEGGISFYECDGTCMLGIDTFPPHRCRRHNGILSRQEQLPPPLSGYVPPPLDATQSRLKLGPRGSVPP